MLLPKESGLLSAVRWHSPNIASLWGKKRTKQLYYNFANKKKNFYFGKKKKKKKTRDNVLMDACHPNCFPVVD